MNNQAIQSVLWPSDLMLKGRLFTPGKDRVVVLGAGVMGPGIAMVFAEHGFDVDLCDVSEKAIEIGSETLKDAFGLKVELGLVSAPRATASIDRVNLCVGFDQALTEARLVIEAVTENREIKSAVYKNVEKLCRPESVVWSNTSTMNVFALSPDALSSRMLVAHWFAPPHILPLVEVVGSTDTPPSLFSESEFILKALGKIPVRLEKFIPGFVINRLLRALGREAFDLIEKGVMTPEGLDVAVRTSLAPRMQILGLMQRYDYTGLNLSLRNLADQEIVDAPINHRPASLVDRVARGELGVATGKGFYDYGGRSLTEMQRARDAKLWQVLTGVGDLISDPRPI